MVWLPRYENCKGSAVGRRRRRGRIVADDRAELAAAPAGRDAGAEGQCRTKKTTRGSRAIFVILRPSRLTCSVCKFGEGGVKLLWAMGVG